MSVLKSSEKDYVRNVFKLINNQVKLSFFTGQPESQASRETREILEELTLMSDKISLTVHNFDERQSEAATLEIDKLPATVIEGAKDYGIRFFGVPAGYLVSSLIEDIVQVSKGESDLTALTKEKLATVKSPLNLQVFVSASSPYCPALVTIAHRMAIESELISAHMIDITEFPHLALRYNVTDVPFTIVNKKVNVAGALDEKDYVEKVLQAYNQSS